MQISKDCSEEDAESEKTFMIAVMINWSLYYHTDFRRLPEI